MKPIFSILLLLITLFSAAAKPAAGSSPEELYKETLQICERMADRVKSGSLKQSEDIISVKAAAKDAQGDWGNMWVEAGSAYRRSEVGGFGCAFADLDRDGSPELLLATKEQFLLAIFTVKNGKSILVDAFWPRHCAAVRNGAIMLRSSGGMDIEEFSVNTLEGHTLRPLLHWNSTRDTDRNKTVYTCGFGSGERQIPASMFNALRGAYTEVSAKGNAAFFSKYGFTEI